MLHNFKILKIQICLKIGNLFPYSSPESWKLLWTFFEIQLIDKYLSYQKKSFKQCFLFSYLLHNIYNQSLHQVNIFNNWNSYSTTAPSNIYSQQWKVLLTCYAWQVLKVLFLRVRKRPNNTTAIICISLFFISRLHMICLPRMV